MSHLPNRQTTRLQWLDYGANGTFYITLNTKDRVPYFGEVIPIDSPAGATMKLSRIGEIASEYWQQIPLHYWFVKLGAFVIMPDHIHGVLSLEYTDEHSLSSRIENPNKFGPQSGNLAAVIRGYKSSVKRFANQNQLAFEWQGRYHERTIRDINALEVIGDYIRSNPRAWLAKTAKENKIKPT